ncbi:MSMEG_0570 family nitrogen starvation response protein [Puniceibacterium sp. IMCC21224]|uniref:MSMEG_0570 family nitrogen starvation response protein n=1 Tax=Puniceibacterium sp. IMCC21224 TaxID=1618204 RepID=UPI00064DBAA1|nr:MSMEG_0570 family nitrogen starvation response protein [Puniceibacterium sp. IMCC21224]KMK66690.1 MSMEG_0570 family protein [Puniceibacterium sp. IMCC21224]
MPEAIFRIRWPDGQEEDCYSPSTAIHQHLLAGQTYRVDDFHARSTTALDHAARRVEAKFGYRCSRADAQAARIAASAKRYTPEESVLCLSIS